MAFATNLYEKCIIKIIKKLSQKCCVKLECLSLEYAMLCQHHREEVCRGKIYDSFSCQFLINLVITGN